MSTITLDTEQAATFTETGRVVLVKPGDFVDPSPAEWPEWQPPVEWAALTGECERCGPYPGSGRRGIVSGTDRYGRHLRWDTCPDCGGTGRPLVTVVTACLHDCERFGGKVPGHARGSNWDWVPCWCDGTGTVTLGTATAEIASSDDLCECSCHDSVRPHGEPSCCVCTDVGSWALILTRHE